MAARGPVPKRSDQRRRVNAPAVPITEAPAFTAVIPTADDAWHPIAKMIYASLPLSGQCRFYESSDWAMAYLICESISLDLKPQFIGFAATGRDETQAEYAVIPLKGASLAAYLKAFSSLLMSEGDRRRASLELQRGAVVDADEESALALVTDIHARFSG